ncbi:MAG: 50S ribosomal protein L4 [Candidatus Omnitrophota bacterium]|nr:50S ribosomal protein L4 [Candidatus Omnitrophota bacterium]
MINLVVYNIEGKKVGNVEIDPKVFGEEIHSASVYQAINAYRANQRKGLASTKDRADVSGGGKKPWRQKGTGRARVGSSRSPLWRHGGVTFGPHPRNFSYSLPKKIKKLALGSALYSKISEEKSFLVLDDIKLDQPKTKNAAKIFHNLKIDLIKNKLLLLVNKIDSQTTLALRNLKNLEIGLARSVNTYQVINSAKIVVTKDGLNDIITRFKK